MDPLISEVKPSSAIRHDYNAFSRMCHETQTPVIVTKDGEADLVVMSHEAYLKMLARDRLGRMLAKVDREIAEGRAMRNSGDVFACLRAKIDDAKKG